MDGDRVVAAPSPSAASAAAAAVDTVEYVHPPSQSILCPVCYDVCRDPLITHVCNHSYCTTCIFQALERESVCPLCRHVLSQKDLHPNLALAGLIQELLVYCPYRQFGCAATIRLDSRESHRKTCGFAPSRCPNYIHGCDFQGGELTVRKHLADCVLQKMKGYIDRNERLLNTMSSQLQTQAREIDELRAYVRRLSLRGSAATAAADGQANGVDHADESEFSRLNNFPRGELQCLSTMAEHSCGVTSLCYDRGTLYSGGHDGTTKVWDFASGTVRRTLVGHQYTVWSLAMDQPRNRLYSASSDGTIKVWNAQAGTTSCIDTLTSHRGRIYSLLIHGDRLFSASSDRTIKVWNLETMECVTTLMGHTDGVNAIVSLDEGRGLATGSHDKTIKIWDLETGTCSKTNNSPTSEVLNMCLGGGLLFSAGYDADIVAYDVRDWTPHATLSGHKWEVWQLVHCDSVLFSGSFDHTIKRWDMRTLSCSATLRGHKGYVHAMTVGESSLISGCADRTIKIWG